MAPGIMPGGWCSRCPLCGPAGECLDPGIKSGRCGDWVWWVSNDFQWRRRWVKGRDPNTPWQQAWRARLAAVSKAYSEKLTAEQQEVCTAAGAKHQTRPRLGQSGHATGQQYWVGKELQANPPARPKARKPKS
jgi:hypothetical protein